MGNAARATLAVAGVILALAILIAVLFWIPSTVHPGMRGLGGEFVSLGLSNVTEVREGASTWYNFTVYTSHDLSLANTTLKILDAGQNAVIPGPAWNLSAWSGFSSPLAEFNFTSGSWNSGQIRLSDAPHWSLSIGHFGNLSHLGDEVEVVGSGVPGGPYQSESPIP